MALIRLNIRNIFYLYTSATFVVLIYVAMNIGDWCTKYTSHDKQTSPKDGEYSLLNSQQSLKVQEQALRTWQQKLTLKEKSLRLQFPHAASSIAELSPLRDNLPAIYAITPTYAREVQKAELTRLSQTFLHVTNLHWIVVEDALARTELVTNLLRESGLRYTHLVQGTPPDYKLKANDPNWKQPRGVLQRNAALDWLRGDADVATSPGVVYFADDDNTYDLKLFEEMRYTDKVSVWPVGLVSKQRYEGPIVKAGKVTAWFTYWKPNRPFAIDMAGFAINIRLILSHPQAGFSLTASNGYQESVLLQGLGVTKADLEPKAEQCTKILVWHTRTEKPRLDNELKFKQKGLPGSDPRIEV